MQNVVSSPGDHLFYLHHTWLDKIWADWQAEDKAKRVKDNIGTENAPGFPSRSSDIQNVFPCRPSLSPCWKTEGAGPSPWLACTARNRETLLVI